VTEVQRSFDPSILEGQVISVTDIQASKVTGSKQPGTSFAVWSTASQRLRPVGAARRTHADCHEAAVRYGDRRWPEWRLYEELRS